MRDDPPLDYRTADGVFGMRIESKVLERILAACRASKRLETGGILVGHYSPDRRVAIVHTVSEPTNDTRAGAFWLVRGVRGLGAWLERLWADRSGHYLGEWHFHPFAAPTPSRQDIRRMRGIAASPDYHCAEPLLLIVGGNPADDWALHIEVHTRAGARHVMAPVSVRSGLVESGVPLSAPVP